MKEDLLKIIEHFGINNQQRKLNEEVFELQEAITKLECKNGYTEDIEEEMVDVIILLKQIFNYYNLSEGTMNLLQENKINRTLERIESGYYDKQSDNS